jgi:hypothetical protein
MHLGERKADHCDTELVESCCRYADNLSTLPVHHSTCVVTCVDNPLRNLPAFRLKANSAEGSDRGESDPPRRKEGIPLLPRAGRVLLEECGEHLPILSAYHSTRGITCAAIEPLRNWPAF